AASPACTSNGPPNPPTSGGSTTPPSPPATTPSAGSTPATAADWAAFGDSLDGALIRPGAPGYGVASQLFNPRFDGSHPAGAAAGSAGLRLGGGQGVGGRKFGRTSDNVTALRIVTAGGEVLTCGPNQHADLFWACRGGGGGNFGVVTSFTFTLHPLTQLARF